MGDKESLRLKAIGLGYRMAWFGARKIPEARAYALAEKLGDRAWRKGGMRKKRILENLAVVLGPGADVEAAARDAFRTYARYWVETFRLPDLPREEMDARFDTENIAAIEKAYHAGKGAVLATMHMGNWDVGGRWVADRWELTAVAEVLRPRKLFDRFLAHRRSLGIDIVPLSKDGDVTAVCAEHLAKGRLVALVADRDLSGRGIEVEMFGRVTKLPPGPAVLALRTGSPLIPAVIYFRPEGRWIAWIMDPLDPPAGSGPEAVAEMTRKLARAFEELASREPSQWHALFQRYWIDE